MRTEVIEVRELHKLKKADLLNFYQKKISAESKQRRKLAVYVFPPEMNDKIKPNTLKVKHIITIMLNADIFVFNSSSCCILTKATFIENKHEWKKSLPLYPCPKPYLDL